MRKPSNKLTAAAVSLAVAGSFGIGAGALANSGVEFNPQNFEAAYTHGGDVHEKGYRANPTETDADANRQGEDGDMDKTASDKGVDDAFSNLPIDGATSGTIAYNLTGNASTGVLVSRGGNAGGSGEGLAASGAVIGGGTGDAANVGGNGENTGAGDADNNGGNGGNADSNGGGNNGDTPAKPWVNPFPDDKSPNSKPNNFLGGDTIPANGKIPALDTITSDNVEDLIKSDRLRVVVQQDTLHDEVALYQGQKLDKWTVFCSLMTQFGYQATKGGDREWYSWTCDGEEAFDTYQYFKITDFPPVVPNGPFEIKYSYRFSDYDTWHTGSLTYTPQRSCVLAMDSAEYTSESSIEKLFGDTIMLYGQNEAALKAAGAVREDGTLSKLLMNWCVDGEDIGFVYKTTPGRHVATPGSFVDLPEYYHAECRTYWMNESYKNDWSSGTRSVLQTLTGVDSDSPAFITDAQGQSTLVIPNGIQAVSATFFDPIYASRVIVPASLVMLDPDDSSLIVGEAYSVSPDNPAFASTKDGILTNKAGDIYEAVPSGIEDLDVPASVKSVNLTNWNIIHHLRLHGSDVANLPAVDLTKLGQCDIELDDEAFYAFITDPDKYSVLNGDEGLTVSMASNPGVAYHVGHGMLYSDEVLERVFAGLDSSLEIEGAHTIAANAFAGNANITTVQLEDDDDYVLEDGCFADSAVRLVVCNTQQQFDYVKSKLDASGAAAAQVALSQIGIDGSKYYTVSDGETETITLVHAPADIVNFEGTFRTATGDAIEPDAIGPKAFMGCENLAWVTLGEKTQSIGQSAFQSCSNLQGLFISTPNSISVGSDALVGCSNLQFVASRAYYGDFATADYIDGCSMYCPTNNAGYTQYFTYFTPESNVQDYDVVRQSDGSLVLCGSSVETDGTHDRWLVIGSGKHLEGEIELPAETLEIYASAFSSVSGPFTINWDDLTNLTYVDGYAFSYSDLAGEVRLGVGSDPDRRVSVMGNAFANCNDITSVSVESPYADLGGASFSACPNLSSMNIASGKDFYQGWGLESGFLGDCSNITLTFTNPQPVTLTPYAEGFAYCFDGWKFSDEEEGCIHLDIPDEYRETYIDQWTYYFAGYVSYDAMYAAKYDALWKELNYDRVPTAFEVQKAMSEELLSAENHMRAMMGLPKVEKSTVLPMNETDDGYTFVEVNGKTVLASAPADAKVIDLNQVIPDSIDDVTIGESAFANCSALQRIVISKKVSAISSKAFAGCDGVKVEFPSATKDTLPELLIDYQDFLTDYTFGANITLVLPADCADIYLRYWTWQEQGYGSEEEIKFLASWFYYIDGISGDELNEAANKPFLEFENYLRGLAAMPQVTELKDMASFCDVASEFDDSGEEGRDIPDIPDYGPDYFRGADGDAVESDSSATNANIAEAPVASGVNGKGASDCEGSTATSGEPSDTATDSSLSRENSGPLSNTPGNNDAQSDTIKAYDLRKTAGEDAITNN